MDHRCMRPQAQHPLHSLSYCFARTTGLMANSMVGTKSWAQRQSGSSGFVPFIATVAPLDLTAQTQSHVECPLRAAVGYCLTPGAGPYLPCPMALAHHKHEDKEPFASRQDRASQTGFLNLAPRP